MVKRKTYQYELGLKKFTRKAAEEKLKHAKIVCRLKHSKVDRFCRLLNAGKSITEAEGSMVIMDKHGDVIANPEGLEAIRRTGITQTLKFTIGVDKEAYWEVQGGNDTTRSLTELGVARAADVNRVVMSSRTYVPFAGEIKEAYENDKGTYDFIIQSVDQVAAEIRGAGYFSKKLVAEDMYNKFIEQGYTKAQMQAHIKSYLKGNINISIQKEKTTWDSLMSEAAIKDFLKSEA